MQPTFLCCNTEKIEGVGAEPCTESGFATQHIKGMASTFVMWYSLGTQHQIKHHTGQKHDIE